MTQMYFLIHNNEDGEASIDMRDAAQLEQELDMGYWGTDVEFYTNLPADCLYIENWPAHKILIIAGEIIVPTPVKVVSKYELRRMHEPSSPQDYMFGRTR